MIEFVHFGDWILQVSAVNKESMLIICDRGESMKAVQVSLSQCTRMNRSVGDILFGMRGVMDLAGSEAEDIPVLHDEHQY